MAIEPTRFSRVSIGWVNSAQSIADKDAGDTGATFSVTGPAAFTGTVTQTGNQTITGTLKVTSTLTVGGAFTQDGAVTLNSTLSGSGAVTFGSTLTVGGGTTLTGAVTAPTSLSVGGGTALQVISTGTAALSFGAINPLESSSVVTFACSGLSRGDFLAICPDSLYPNVAANRDISFFCSSSSTAGEAHAWAVNSTLTAVTPTASTFFRWLRVKAGNFPAA